MEIRGDELLGAALIGLLIAKHIETKKAAKAESMAKRTEAEEAKRAEALAAVEEERATIGGVLDGLDLEDDDDFDDDLDDAIFRLFVRFFGSFVRFFVRSIFFQTII